MWLRYDAAVQVLHDVEGGADDGGIFAEAVDFWDWDVGGLEGGEDAVFALDFVGGFGDEGAGGLFAEDEFEGGGRGEEVGGVGLAETELGVVRLGGRFVVEGVLRTCLRVMGVLMAGTLASM